MFRIRTRVSKDALRMTAPVVGRRRLAGRYWLEPSQVHDGTYALYRHRPQDSSRYLLVDELELPASMTSGYDLSVYSVEVLRPPADWPQYPVEITVHNVKQSRRTRRLREREGVDEPAATAEA